MGLPGLTVTTDRNDNRPVGVQLVASHFREDILLNAAKIIAPKFDVIWTKKIIVIPTNTKTKYQLGFYVLQKNKEL